MNSSKEVDTAPEDQALIRSSTDGASELIPCSVRLRQTLRDHDIKGEKEIAAGQAVISCFIMMLHLLAQFSNNWQSINFWVISALVALIASSALRFFLVNGERRRERQLDVVTVVDLSIFLALIWSYQYAYNLPAGGVLKSPSFILLAVLVALRALRFHPRPIIIAGATAAIGWCLIVFVSLRLDGAIAVTHDYPEYLTSYKILIGAELERVVALAALTLFLAVATYQARSILSKAAHAQDYSEALEEAQVNLEVATCSKERAEEVLVELQKRDDEITVQNERFNAALDNMSQGLCMFDGEQRLIVANHHYASLYGLSSEQVKPGTTLRQILEYRIANGFYAGMNPEAYIKEQLDWVIIGKRSNKVHTLNDGRSIAITHTPMANRGWLTTHGDVTEQVRSAQLLEQQAEELKEALNNEKKLSEQQRQFVAMASHEFRTPLAIIDSTAQRLKSSANKNRLTPEDAVQRVEKIRAAVERMTRLMESTLKAARMEDGKISVEIGICKLEMIIREVCERQQELAKDHIITCDLTGLPESIQADSGALEQVFTNLLSNAVKYAPGTPNIEVTGCRKDDHVVISVRDYGLGIDEDDLPKMFGRFFRAKTSAGIAGTGIGLNLLKTLVEMHDGQISVESKKGEGSVFTVHLPIAGPEQTEETVTKAA